MFTLLLLLLLLIRRPDLKGGVNVAPEKPAGFRLGLIFLEENDKKPRALELVTVLTSSERFTCGSLARLGSVVHSAGRSQAAVQ